MFKKLLLSLPIIGIILLAAFLRLYHIADYMTFLGDEGRDVLVVYNILHGKFTLLGPTSSVGGFFLGPIYYYFMTPFLWLFHYNPVGPAVMIALCSLLVVWLVYKIGTTVFGRGAGIIAAFLYAISPVVITYSRSSWNPNLMPLFTIITLFLVYQSVKKVSIKWMLIAGISFGILMQLHYLATFVGAIIFIYLLLIYVIFPKCGIGHISYRTLGLSYIFFFLGFLIGWSPFLAFEARHGFRNIIGITNFIFNSPEVHASGNFFGTIGNVFFRLFGRLITNFPPLEEISIQAHSDILIWFILTLLLSIGSFGLFIIQFGRMMKEKGERIPEKILQYSLLVTWFIVGIILFGFYKKAIYDYYFEFMFPLSFWLVGNFFIFFFKRNIVFKLLTVIALCGLGYINLQSAPFRSPANKQLEQIETISRFVLEKTSNKPYNFALITGGNSDHAYRYFFTIWGHPPTTIEFPGVDPERKTVTNQLLIVCEEKCAPLGNSLWEVAGFGRAEISGKWDVSVVQVYKLVHYKEMTNINGPK